MKGYIDFDFTADMRIIKVQLHPIFPHCVVWLYVENPNHRKAAALPSIEAEYITATNAIKERIWLSGLLNELDYLVEMLFYFLLIKPYNKNSLLQW